MFKTKFILTKNTEKKYLLKKSENLLKIEKLHVMIFVLVLP